MSLLGKLTRLFGQDSPATAALDPWLDQVVAATDPRIAQVPTYKEQLAPALEQARIYFAEALAQVPGPLPLDVPHPLHTQLFPEPGDLQAALGRSMAVKQEMTALENAGHTQLFALLGMRLKTTEADAAPQLTDHTLRSLAPSPAQARQSLEDTALDSLLQGFAHITRHQQSKLELAQSQKERVQEARSQSQRRARFSGISQSLDAHIARASHELNPEKILASLLDWLSSPESCLRINLAHGHLLRPSPPHEALQLPMLSSQDRRQWLVCLVEFPITQARAALAAENHNHRFILI